MNEFILTPEERKTKNHERLLKNFIPMTDRQFIIHRFLNRSTPGAGKFVKLDYEMIDHPTWIKLSPAAKIVFIRIKQHRYIKTKKGVINHSDQAIRFKCVDMPEKISRSTFYKSIKELIAAGFIEIVKKSSFKNKSNTVYAISENWKYDHGIYEPAF